MHVFALSDFTHTEPPVPPQPVGVGYRLVHHAAQGTDGLDFWIALPDRPQPDAVPLVSIHGVLRDARGQALGFAAEAAKAGRVVIAPLFDKARYPAYQRLILGRRADRALLSLLDRLDRTGQADCRRFDLFGYSGGAQFAHRFALLYPQRVRRLTLAAAGWYTFPDDCPYPYGLASPRRPTRAWGPHVEAGLIHLLERPIQVCVGELDNQPDALTRTGPDIDRQQGRDRLARAANWVDAMQRAGEARGIETDIRLYRLPGVGHDFRDCIRQGGVDVITLTE